MTVSQKELDSARGTGAQGGTVNTIGRSWQDKNVIDKAVKEGKTRQ